ncbi:hypothetical protein Sgly_1839 [Syntrophobotulus glycolicus DSM 8271]|uniref:Uncharacterized protein n=1 Tax=Syntrophobotulus glycolicus (strain DSM 8271 / FlGlyR) TaxID=645991 RepID=F0T049_SYNGF|nr:hypothetical protein [Syntrophobotulus glycolicus]ADY56136.1 hypothetical protein Sgly_1839 [Syntrophobotulus glycolicus DSM 8271]
MTKENKNFSNYANIIGTIATAILAVTALITVYITVTAWKEQREANRPYFTFKESPQVVLLEKLEFNTKLTNVGKHPATKLLSKSVVLPHDLKGEPFSVEKNELVNDIPQDASATLTIFLENPESPQKENKPLNLDPYFIVINLYYEDPIIKETFNQSLYLKWNGIKNGSILSTSHAEQDEKDKILEYLQSNQINMN